MRVTAAITTIGAQTFAACRQALEGQPCLVEVIANVSPFAAAMNEAVRRCTTEMLVQVDEDMILQPNAVERLVTLIDKQPANVVMASAPLWDQDLRRVIYGCKIYRHALLVGIPFEPHVLGDTHDRRVWERHGLSSAKAPRTEQDCVGLHGTHYTPEQAFARWRGMWQRHRMTGNMKWIESWLSKLGNRYRTSGSRVDLFAMIGAYVGATETLWSEDASRCNAALAELLARVPEAE